MAERVVDTLIDNHPFTARPCSTAEVPLPGGERVTLATALKGVDEVQAERLARLYGTEAPELVAAVSENGLVAAEVGQAVLHEGAQRLEDYWVRRSSRAWFDEGAGLARLPQAASAMAALLGWDEARQTAEIQNCRDIDRDSRAGFTTGTSYSGDADDVRAAS